MFRSVKVAWYKTVKSLYETDSGWVRWYNDAQDILLLRVHESPTWDEIYQALNIVNNTIIERNHSIYTIYHFEQSTLSLPHHSLRANIAELLAQQVENEVMIITVNYPTLRSLIRMVAAVSGLFDAVNKYHYTETLEEALIKIETHKLQPPPQIRKMC